MIATVDVDELRRVVRWDRCEECSGRLSVVWQGAPPPAWGKGELVLHCTKNAEHKGTRPYFASKEEIDMVNESSTTLVRYETPMGLVELSVESIRMYLSPKATAAEAYIFLQKCRFQRLNPFLGEVFLVVYEQTQTSPRNAQMIVGKEAYTRRAERHPDYMGMEAGLMVRRDGKVEQVPGAFMAPDDQLLGGWCQVKRKGKDLPLISVLLKEYDNGRRQWKQMPATMIRKVAVVQALREAFPSEMAGLQEGDEFGLAEDQPTVIEGQLAQALAESAAPQGRTHTRESRDLERDIDDLFPPDTSYTEVPPLDEPFDPETAPPPPLPDVVNSRGHFEQVLKDEEWTIGRLELQVLKVPLDRYIREGHKLQDAYLAWKEHVGK